MRLNSLIGSFCAVLLSASSVFALEESHRIVWCPDIPVIELADCHDQPPALNDPSSIAFAIKDGCLGAPIDDANQGVGNSGCENVRLFDEVSRVPISRDCESTIVSTSYEREVKQASPGGVISVPLWVDRVLFRCPGYADTFISVNAVQQTMLIPRGCEIETTILEHPTDGFDGDLPFEGIVELQQEKGEFSIEKEIQLGEKVSLGSVPTGSYVLTVTFEGAAVVVDTLNVAEAEVPLQLLYHVAPGRCVTVNLSCSECDVNTQLGYRLFRFAPPGPPDLYSEGSLFLRSVGENRWESEICDLPRGRFEMTLSSSGFQSVSRVVEVEDKGASTQDIEMLSGINSFVGVFDEDGIPIPDALVVTSWRSGGQRERAEVITDENGFAEISPLIANTKFRLYIRHEDYLVPDPLEGLAGDRLLAVLRKNGAIVATLIGDICTEKSPELSVEVEWLDGERSQRRIESFWPNNCALDIPIKRPGIYLVTINGADIVPYHEEIDLRENLNRDLGEIELIPGKTLSVKVVHKLQPVSGAAVRLSRAGPSKLTDSGGFAEFASLAADAGSVSIYVSHPEFASRTASYDTDNTAEITVEVFEGGEITGQVITEDGLPSVGETILAYGSEKYSTSVDGQGFYKFSLLDPGEWRVVRLRVIGERTAGMIISTGDSQAVTVRDGEAVQVDFIPEIRVDGRVFIDGHLSFSAEVTAFRASGSAGYGPSIISFSVSEFGQYSTHLPGEGAWVFRLGERETAAEISNCPCVQDLFFEQKPQKGGQ